MRPPPPPLPQMQWMRIPEGALKVISDGLAVLVPLMFGIFLRGMRKNGLFLRGNCVSTFVFFFLRGIVNLPHYFVEGCGY